MNSQKTKKKCWILNKCLIWHWIMFYILRKIVSSPKCVLASKTEPFGNRIIYIGPNPMCIDNLNVIGLCCCCCCGWCLYIKPSVGTQCVRNVLWFKSSVRHQFAYIIYIYTIFEKHIVYINLVYCVRTSLCWVFTSFVLIESAAE